VRLLLTVSLLVVATFAQVALQRHLAPAADLAPGTLAASLTTLPLQIEHWRGQDRPIQDERSLYADEHLQRGYYHVDGKQGALLWMAFSASGEDRGHHPEVCMAVAGNPEDVSARREIQSPGHAAPIQQYGYGRNEERQLVYYWYYTLPTPGNEQLTDFQRAFRRFRVRPASLTVEVFAPNTNEGSEESAQQFVRAVDQQIQALVGPRAERGSQRIPVTVIPTAEPTN
jgi:hypothetical protein